MVAVTVPAEGVLPHGTPQAGASRVDSGMAESVFNLLTVLPLPVWAAMLLFPRARFTRTLITADWPFLTLAALYIAVLIGALTTGASTGLGLSFTALHNIMASEWGFVAVWSHLITLDLFVGVWIFRDAKYFGINPGLFLLVTFFAGPLGLGNYLLARQRHRRSDPARPIN